MACFHFSHIPVFKIRGGRVVDKRRTLPSRPPTPSVVPNLATTTLLVVEAVRNISSLLPTLSAAPILATPVTSEAEVVGNVLSPFSILSTVPISTTTVPSIVEVDDDSPSSPDFMVDGSDSLSTPSIVEVEDDSFFLPSEIITSPSVDVCHQDKGKKIVIGDEERAVPKGASKKEDAGANSRGIKKSRMALLQETSGSVPTSPIAAQALLPICSPMWSVSTSGLVRTN
ncbi:hypothetical protein Adt_31948 [Abeliophyllum distichum]|uniref:Uncharacterized protein n=1 Tax=Abeliophyllum distichum TaxID=126358 RepID=A0ABD1RH00_9LAMI